jgi:hypothetical protein
LIELAIIPILNIVGVHADCRVDFRVLGGKLGGRLAGIQIHARIHNPFHTGLASACDDLIAILIKKIKIQVTMRIYQQNSQTRNS